MLEEVSLVSVKSLYPSKLKIYLRVQTEHFNNVDRSIRDNVEFQQILLILHIIVIFDYYDVNPNVVLITRLICDEK